MAGIPSIGDILMLSQLAWKIGCAFTSGRAGAPAEFREVENELHGLTKALTLLAEALDQDDSIISRADERTKEGLDKILECCRQTLENLNSFVSQYQEIKKPDGPGGMTTQRSWKRLLVRNYKTICWTGEGGNIQALRSMLHMHVNSISLTMQALHSRSLSRLENTIEPMADKVDDMHNKLNGDLNVKIDEMHHLMLSMASRDLAMAPLQESPPRTARQDSLPKTGPGDGPSPEALEAAEPPFAAPLQERQRTQPNAVAPPTVHAYDFSPSTARHIPPRPPRPDAAELSGSEYSASPPHYRSPGGSIFDRRASDMIPFGSPTTTCSEAPPRYERPRKRSQVSPRGSSASSPILERDSYRRPSDPSLPFTPASPMMLPLPAIQGEDDEDAIESQYYALSAISEKMTHPEQPERVAIGDTQRKAFENSIFVDAAVLCQVRGRCVEYTQPDDEEPGDFRMVQAAASSDFYLVTKRHKLSTGLMCFTTSIWVLSDDGSVRMQQELEDGREVVPYTVWGNNEKISLRVPTELRFHDLTLDSKPLSVAKTSWVNYCFDDERASTAFQNALMGKTLILSVQTTKTIRLHDGFTGSFAYQEQMCALENLRIWQDPDTGGVLAMLHYSAHFRDGYMAFYLNSARDPVRVRDDGDRFVKLKGLSIPLQPQKPHQPITPIDLSKPAKPKNEKRITGARIEFTTEQDKKLFLEKFREVQGYFYAGDR